MKFLLGTMTVMAIVPLAGACAAATPTATTVPTLTPRPTAVPTPTALALTDGALVVTQAISGTFEMVENQIYLSSRQALPDLSLVDFSSSAHFHNPYTPTASETWRYGTYARFDLVKLRGHVVWYNSDGSWQHFLLMDGQATELAKGNWTTAAMGKDESNELRLLVLESQGQLWINGQFVTSLDLSRWVEPGNVMVAGMSSVPGTVMDFEDWYVWSLD